MLWNKKLINVIEIIFKIKKTFIITITKIKFKYIRIIIISNNDVLKKKKMHQQ